MAFQFVGVGIPEAQEASGVFRLADHLYIAKAGGGVDYILGVWVVVSCLLI